MSFQVIDSYTFTFRDTNVDSGSRGPAEALPATDTGRTVDSRQSPESPESPDAHTEQTGGDTQGINCLFDTTIPEDVLLQTTLHAEAATDWLSDDPVHGPGTVAQSITQTITTVSNTPLSASEKLIAEAKSLRSSGSISNEEYRLRMMNAIPEDEWAYGGPKPVPKYLKAKTNIGHSSVQADVTDQPQRHDTVPPSARSSPESKTTRGGGRRSGSGGVRRSGSKEKVTTKVTKVTKISVGEHVLVSTQDSQEAKYNFAACVMAVRGSELDVNFYKYPKFDAAEGFTRNSVNHQCDMKDIICKLNPPEPINPARTKRGPVTFPELKGATEKSLGIL